MLDKMGVKIVLNPEHVSEDDLMEAHKEGSSVVVKKIAPDGKDKKE